MQKFKEKMKALWSKTKAFMQKKYYGVPVWGYALGLVLIVPLSIYLIFGGKRLKNSKPW